MSQIRTVEDGAATRELITIVVRSVAQLALILVAYATVPIQAEGSKLIQLAVTAACAVAIVVLLVRQVRHIQRARYPRVRAVEATVVVAALFVALVSLGAYTLEYQVPGSFNESLTRVDAAYYVVSTLVTVGFGDIHPVTELARGLAIVQMVLNVLLIGVGIRVILGVASSMITERR